MKPASCIKLKLFQPMASSTTQMRIVEEILIVERATAEERCVTVAPAKLKETQTTEATMESSSALEWPIWRRAPGVSA